MIGISRGTIPYKLRISQIDEEQSFLMDRMSDLLEMIHRQDPNYKDLYGELRDIRERITELDLERSRMTPWWRKFFQID